MINMLRWWTFGAHHRKSAQKFLQGLVATNKCLVQSNKSRTGPRKSPTGRVFDIAVQTALLGVSSMNSGAAICKNGEYK
jgi:hypothetical protein